MLNIARALLNDPASLRSQCDWAAWAGLSPRTLSRRFLQETGISFALAPAGAGIAFTGGIITRRSGQRGGRRLWL